MLVTNTVKWVGEGNRNESFQVPQDGTTSLWAYAGGGDDFLYGKDQPDYLSARVAATSSAATTATT
jgi:hypothetical protein